MKRSKRWESVSMQMVVGWESGDFESGDFESEQYNEQW
jgi:hypothetical protein